VKLSPTKGCKWDAFCIKGERRAKIALPLSSDASPRSAWPHPCSSGVKELPPWQSPPVLPGAVCPSFGGHAVSSSGRHCVEEKIPQPITGGAQRSSPRIEWWCVELGAAADSFMTLLRPCVGGGGEGPATRAPADGMRRTQPPTDPPAFAGSTCAATPLVGDLEPHPLPMLHGRGGELDSQPPERWREEGKGQRHRREEGKRQCLCSASGLLFSGRRSRGGPHRCGALAGGREGVAPAGGGEVARRRH
jgi:hypothetical protein